jgi:hypothetical protein
MGNLLTIGFDFQEQSYLSLVRVKEKEGFMEYQVTVMNGELEKQLYGHHILREINGFLHVIAPAIQENLRLLQFTIAKAIGMFLKVQVAENEDGD